MMRVRLRAECAERIRQALERAGIREIGGVLVGEHVGVDAFDIVDASVQTSDGSAATFVRSAIAHQGFMDDFRRLHGGDHARYNYLGEWHSHPSFSLSPSSVDLQAMTALMEDPEQVATFALLMIVKLDERGRLLAEATCHQRLAPVSSVELSMGVRDGLFARTSCALRRWFTR